MKRIYWAWIIPSLAIGFTLGICFGAIIQSRADTQIAERERTRSLADMETVVDGFENVLADLEQFYESQIVLASYYADKFHGRKMANGEIFDMYKFTAAHKTMKMGTILLIEHIKTGKMVLVRITDRGPFYPERTIDLSFGAAQSLGMLEEGLAVVKITEIWRPR